MKTREPLLIQREAVMKRIALVGMLLCLTHINQAAHLEQNSPFDVAELLRTDAFYPYTAIDDEENTYLHWFVERGDVEKTVAMINYYPFTTKNKNGERPIDLIEKQLKATADNSTKERLILCATILHAASKCILNPESAVAVIHRTPDALLLADNAEIFVRLLNKAVRFNNHSVFNVLAARYEKSKEVYDKSLQAKDMQELKKYIDQHGKNNSEFKSRSPKPGGECVIV